MHSVCIWAAQHHNTGGNLLGAKSSPSDVSPFTDMPLLYLLLSMHVFTPDGPHIQYPVPLWSNGCARPQKWTRHLRNATENSTRAVHQDMKWSLQKTKQTVASSFKMKLTEDIAFPTFVDLSVNDNLVWRHVSLRLLCAKSEVLGGGIQVSARDDLALMCPCSQRSHLSCCVPW